MTAPAPDFDFPDEPDDDYNLITTERVFTAGQHPADARLPASLPRTGGSSLPSLMRPRPRHFRTGGRAGKNRLARASAVVGGLPQNRRRRQAHGPVAGYFGRPVPGALTP